MQQYKQISYSKILEIEKRTFSEFCQEQTSISLLNGLSGISFFYYNLYLLNKDENVFSRMEYIIDRVLENANNSTNTLTYCDGLAGMGFMLNYFKTKEIISDDIESYLCDLDEIMMGISTDRIEEGFLDFLHGAIGILHYLFQRTHSNDLVKSFIKNISAPLFNKIKVEVNMGTTTNASFYDGVEVKHMNLGMAHGLISILFFISKYYNYFPDKQEVQEAAQLILEVFEKNECPNSQSISKYPSIVNEHGHNLYNTPLGWCYGDSITALAMGRFAKANSSISLLQKANNVARYTLKRNTPATAFVHDGCLCHGTTSNVQIYKRWYQLTGDADYKKAYENWIIQTISMGKEPDGIGGYKRYYGEGSQNEFGILNGATGVGLVLLDFISGKDSDWDELLLLN
jgi:lantibiotic biosynthesis protein